MSYKTNQWQGLSAAGEKIAIKTNDGGVYMDQPGDNRPFIYPNRTVRSMDPKNDPLLSERKLQRGYIRNVEVGGFDIPNARCHFQFNPTTLNQSVSVNEGVLNFMQQDLAGFATPMQGANNFTFDLLFDRSAELNSTAPNNTSIVNLDDTNAWEALPPEEVGVLHDLSVLFGIIGVGISERLKEYTLNVYTQQAKVEYSDLSAEEQAEALSEDEFLVSARSRVSENMGNSSFLYSLPVRVVFSSLYIVEGLVSGINVSFSKFNQAYVPMMCGVSITMKAFYIGFAKKNTFFSSSLAALAEAQREEAATLDENAETPDEVTFASDLLARLKQEIPAITLSLQKSDGATSRTVYPTRGANSNILLSNFVSYGTGTVNPSPVARYNAEATLRLFFSANVDSNTESTSNLIGILARSGGTFQIHEASVRVYYCHNSWLSSYKVPGPVTAYAGSALDAALASATSSAGSFTLPIIRSDDSRKDLAINQPPVKLLREVVLNEGTKGSGGGVGDSILSISGSTTQAELMLVKNSCYTNRHVNTFPGNDTFTLSDELISEDHYGVLYPSEALGTRSDQGRLVIQYKVRGQVTDNTGNSFPFNESYRSFVSSAAEFGQYNVMEAITIPWPGLETTGEGSDLDPGDDLSNTVTRAPASTYA